MAAQFRELICWWNPKYVSQWKILRHGGNGLMVTDHWFYKKRLRLYAQSSVKNRFSEVESFSLLQLGEKTCQKIQLVRNNVVLWIQSLPGFGDCNVIGSFRQYIHKVIGSVLVITFMFMFQICDFRQKNNFPFFHLILLVKICWTLTSLLKKG